jgi:hypothetical protein
MNTAWQMRLDEACSNADVLEVVGDFLATWASLELKAIAVELRPAALNNAQQVNAYAFLLARMLTGNAKTQPELHRMSTFFTKASLRIFQLAENARASGPGDKGSQSQEA